MKLDYRNMTPVGKCPKCGINCWAEHNNEPAIWPCGLDECPYPDKSMKGFDRSSTGSSLALLDHITA